MRAVVLYDLRRVAGVDLHDELGELAAHGLVELLEELEAAVLDEGPARLHVVGQDGRELLQDVLLHLDGGLAEQRLEGLEVRALGQDGLERPLRLDLRPAGEGRVGMRGEGEAEFAYPFFSYC